MDIYLPIAEMSVNIFSLLFIGAGVGFLSGMFGVGGGFLTTPLLILIGVPPTVAVASEANHITGSSVAGFLAHLNRKNVDLKMGLVLLLGGILGSVVGVILFRLLAGIGQIEAVISISYVVVLGIVGPLMLRESLNAHRRKISGRKVRLHDHGWIHGLPLRIRFRRSKLYISIIPPIFLSFFIGILATLIGVGGGFILVPAMIYILGMPTQVVIGTSLMQITFVTAVATILHAAVNHTVDVILSMLLLLGAVAGVQMGSRMVQRLPGEQLRFLLGILVVIMAVGLASGMIGEPTNRYNVEFLK